MRQYGGRIATGFLDCYAGFRANSPRLVQKYMAIITVTTGRTAPNSSIKYLVCPVSLVSGEQIAWIKRLWLACKIAAVHKLFDFSRNHVKIKLSLTTIMVKQGKTIPCGGAAIVIGENKYRKVPYRPANTRYQRCFGIISYLEQFRR